MKTYSHDLRERVVAACDDGRLSRPQIAHLFHVSVSWIRRLLQRRRETGSFAARARGGSPRVKMTDAYRAQLLVLVAEQPDATLLELRDRLQVPVHPCTVSRALAQLGLTRKKKSCGPPSKTVPTCSTSVPAGGVGLRA